MVICGGFKTQLAGWAFAPGANKRIGNMKPNFFKPHPLYLKLLQNDSVRQMKGWKVNPLPHFMSGKLSCNFLVDPDLCANKPNVVAGRLTAAFFQTLALRESSCPPCLRGYTWLSYHGGNGQIKGRGVMWWLLVPDGFFWLPRLQTMLFSFCTERRETIFTILRQNRHWTNAT